MRMMLAMLRFHTPKFNHFRILQTKQSFPRFENAGSLPVLFNISDQSGGVNVCQAISPSESLDEEHRADELPILMERSSANGGSDHENRGNEGEWREQTFHALENCARGRRGRRGSESRNSDGADKK
jgi:hypothetical protein